MPKVTIARLDPDPNGGTSQNVMISGQTIAIVVALIGALPPLTTALFNWTTARVSTSSQEKVQLADADLKRRQAEVLVRQNEAEWLKLALAQENADGDRKLLDLL